MRYLIFTILILSITSVAYATNDARFDFSIGQPEVVENATSATGNCAIRYDFSRGQPMQMYDATASCPASATASQPRMVISKGSVYINSRVIIN